MCPGGFWCHSFLDCEECHEGRSDRVPGSRWSFPHLFPGPLLGSGLDLEAFSCTSSQTFGRTSRESKWDDCGMIACEAVSCKQGS